MMVQPNDSVLKSIVDKLRDEFHPMNIYLFGSHARGEQNFSSDYDLVVVVKDSPVGQIERSVLAQKITWNLSGADIFVYTEKEFNDLESRYGSVAYIAKHDGISLDVSMEGNLL